MKENRQGFLSRAIKRLFETFPAFQKVLQGPVAKWDNKKKTGRSGSTPGRDRVKGAVLEPLSRALK